MLTRGLLNNRSFNILSELMAMDKNEFKQATKEAIKEWLDERFAQFGRWSAGAFAAAGLAALTYFILRANGWHK